MNISIWKKYTLHELEMETGALKLSKSLLAIQAPLLVSAGCWTAPPEEAVVHLAG